MLLCDAFKMLLMVGAEILSTFPLVKALLQLGGTYTKNFHLLEICELGYF